MVRARSARRPVGFDVLERRLDGALLAGGWLEARELAVLAAQRHVDAAVDAAHQAGDLDLHALDGLLGVEGQPAMARLDSSNATRRWFCASWRA